MITDVFRYSWRDVRPSQNPFALETVRPLVAAHLAGWERDDYRLLSYRSFETALDCKLLATYGVWALGWQWGLLDHLWDDEMPPSVPNPDEEMLPYRFLSEGNDDGLVEHLTAGLEEWRKWTEELEETFATLEAARTAKALSRTAIENVARRLLTIISPRATTAQWHRYYVGALVWYLEAAGVHAAWRFAPSLLSAAASILPWGEGDAAMLNPLITQIATADWIAPWSDRDRDRASATDALDQWRVNRAVPKFQRAFVNAPIANDGYHTYVNRDLRSDAMSVALDACRESAGKNEPLTLELLSTWNGVVLGKPASLRTKDAFSERARERYGVASPAHVEEALRDANASDDSPPVHVVMRAARVYLDICFLKPFEDGNARVAQLALDHLLTRDRKLLHTAAPLFKLPIRASDAKQLEYFSSLLDYCVVPIPQEP